MDGRGLDFCGLANGLAALSWRFQIRTFLIHTYTQLCLAFGPRLLAACLAICQRW